MSNVRPKRAPNTKSETLLKMLHRQNGESLDEITRATDWQPHSARAMISRLKKQGHTIAREKAGIVRRYGFANEVVK